MRITVHGERRNGRPDGRDLLLRVDHHDGTDWIRARAMGVLTMSASHRDGRPLPAALHAAIATAVGDYVRGRHLPADGALPGLLEREA